MTPEQAMRERAIDAQRAFAEEYARQQRDRLAEEAKPERPRCCPSMASYGYHGFGCTAPRDYCCIGYAQGIGHDGTCSQRFSRSAGS